MTLGLATWHVQKASLKMTGDQNVETPAQEAVEPTVSDEQSVEAPELAKVREEAAKRRVALREVEAERDALTTQVRSLALRLGAGEHLSDPTVLPWSDEFTDDEGNIDQEKISEAAEAYALAHPHAAKVRGDAGQGFRGEPATGVDLAAMLRASA